MSEGALYRPCVGAILLNKDGMVFMGRKKKQDWHGSGLQMPQGGIDSNETTEEAVHRELYEETGVKNAKIIATSNSWYSYRFPSEVSRFLYQGRYIGQIQKWFVLEFLGDDSEINVALMASKNKKLVEFDNWKWVAPEDVINVSLPIKREIYSNVLAEFENIIFNR